MFTNYSISSKDIKIYRKFKLYIHECERLDVEELYKLYLDKIINDITLQLLDIQENDLMEHYNSMYVHGRTYTVKYLNFLRLLGFKFNKYRDHALVWAVENGKLKIIEWFISIGYKLEESGTNFIATANLYNQLEVANYLISIGYKDED